MFSNYFKTALRNLLREKSSSIINLCGLTLGITCSLLLFLMITYFLSFDTFHSRAARIYRVVNESEGNHGKKYQSGVPAVLPDAFRNDFPEAEAVVFTSYRSHSVVTIPQAGGVPKKYPEERGIVYTEPDFFKIFDRAVIMGDAAAALDEPYEAIISRAWAKKYFGKEDAIGEVLQFDEQTYKIAAIMADAPSHTDLPFDLMLSYVTVKKKTEADGWKSIWSDEQCYFLLREGETIAPVKKRLEGFAKKYIGTDDPDNTQFMVQPLQDMHFDDRFDTYSYSTIPRGLIVAFGVIAFILIVTACINFINLTTAEAIKRSKEVGIRKTLGSSRAQLIGQFMSETMLVTLVAVVASLALTQMALTFLNPFLNLALSFNFSENGYLWIYLAGITIMVSLLSGLYPAFVVSGYRPALALKNQINNKSATGHTLRRALVVVQFCISQLFIIGTIVIIQQMDYFQKKDLGFAKDAILVVPIPEAATPSETENHKNKMRALRDAMARVTGVENVSLSNAPPSSGNVSSTNLRMQGIDKNYAVQVKAVDGNYLDLFKLDLVAGRDIQDLDTVTGYIVNEKLTRTMGFNTPEEVLGRVIKVWRKEYPIVGVVKDFHTVSLHRPIEATVLFNDALEYHSMALKVNLTHAPEIIDQLKAQWEAAYPEQLFEYQFLDASIRQFYDGEKKMSILLTLFSSMAIFIGCLGLFGLATFMANQKTKEIGVRKALGASVGSIVMMFSKEYVKLIVLGFLFSAPFAWLLMDAFLSEFAYKIDLGPGIFFLGLTLTLLIAVATVGYKSFKAATADPVRSLRYE